MRHQKIIRREDGTRVCIDVTFRSSYFSNDTGLDWEISVSVVDKGKRKFIPVACSGDIEARGQRPERNRYAKSRSLSVVSEQEVLDAMLEAWDKAKPEFDCAVFKCAF